MKFQPSRFKNQSAAPAHSVNGRWWWKFSRCENSARAIAGGMESPESSIRTFVRAALRDAGFRNAKTATTQAGRGNAVGRASRLSLIVSRWKQARRLSYVCFSGWCLLLAYSINAATLAIEITPTFADKEIQLASLRYTNSAGENLSITRVSFLASDFALQRTDGSWFEISNSVGWFDLEQNRNSIRFNSVPAENFRAIRFSIGVNTNLNHADIAQFPADHPLNPNLNGLHWSWQGGFIFLAMEGLWLPGSAGVHADESAISDQKHAGTDAGAPRGWSYHFARDTNLVRVKLAANLTTTGDATLELSFDLATLLDGPHPLSFAKDGASTHSRDGDPIAAALKANLPGAFRVKRTGAANQTGVATHSSKPLYLPKKFTPYRFQMSATAPVPDLPLDNPLIVERVELGKKLFFDKRVSINNEQSCADCHAPEKAFTDGRRVARGAEGNSGTRNSMPLFNLAWKREFFWDGRAKSLREQVLQPIENPVEMHQSLTNLVAKLYATGRAGSPLPAARSDATDGAHGVTRPTNDYPALFEAAFGSTEITSEKIALALENYLLTLTSFDSKFDRVLKGEAEFSKEEQRGFELFNTEYDPRREQYGADCFHCHGGPLFQSQTFANNGSDAAFKDIGREKVTGKAADRGKFAVPSLRNVALTAPYMHDGRFRTLEEVIEHYSTGIPRSATLDPNLAKHPDGGVPLSEEDKRALVAFLKTLTDDKFSALSGQSDNSSGAD